MAVQESGVNMMQLPTYDWGGEINPKFLSEYYNEVLTRNKKGKSPAWWESALPQLREGMSRGNYESTYGRPGERTGTMQTATEAGALTGIGPKSTMAFTGKASKDYADREKSIDEYLTAQGVNVMQRSEEGALSGLANVPRGPETAYSPFSGVSGQQPAWMNQLGELAGTLAGNLFGNQNKPLGRTTSSYPTSSYPVGGGNYSQGQYGGINTPASWYGGSSDPRGSAGGYQAYLNSQY